MSLSIIRINKISVSNIQILFSDDIDPNIGIDNIIFESLIDSVSNPNIISVIIENDLLNISFRSIFPNIQYKITFVSTIAQFFQTINGDIISGDGNRNILYITSPGEDISPVRDAIFNDIPTIYETEEPSLVRTLISSIASEFQKSIDSVQTVKSANYISVTVTDERMVRNDGPIDRFLKGGVYEVLRVGPTPTQSQSFGSIDFNSTVIDDFEVNSFVIINPILATFTADPISLQAIQIINEKVSDDTNLDNHFSGLLIKVANRPIIQLISISLIRDSVIIPYDINEFGYTLKDNKYDTNLASINVNLSDQEVELSSSSITGLPGGFLEPRAGDEIRISYIYKKLGRNIDSSTVELDTIKSVTREIAPPIINKFTLKHAPIVDTADEIPVTDGAIFLNTDVVDGNPPLTITHPAFAREIKFNLGSLPARPGEYSINYNTGDVYVFGEDARNTGTGSSPPAVDYSYRNIFIEGLDYTLNSDRNELAVNSSRNIGNIEVKITFEYEDVFANGEDFEFLSHIEILNERINNRLIDSFRVRPQNFPITDVFRIFNETTGEVYSPVRFSDTDIVFSGRQAPIQTDITRERVSFIRIPQEILLVSDELLNDANIRIFKIELENSGIVDSQGLFIGANFDTSIILSDTIVFARERFYEDQLFDDISANLNRLSQISEYLVDYVNGVIYVAVSSIQDTDIGDISYKYNNIQTRNKHILGVNDIYRSASSIKPKVKSYSVGNIQDESVNIIGLEQVGERFINGDSSRVILVGSYQNGNDGITTDGIALFTSNSSIFTADDLQRTIIVGSNNQTPIEEVRITGVVNNHQVTVDPAFSYTNTGRVWDIIDLSDGASKVITLASDILSVKNIYLVDELGVVVASELDGYFDISRDSISGNEIILGDSNPLSVGDTVIVNYRPGSIFIDYRYLQDELLVSYEYGNNSLDWSISNALSTDEEYFVTYRYGALREPLLTNFGSLTQIPQLTTFSPNLDREIYRSIVGGTLQSFIEGPTIPSIKRLVKSFTDVDPNISESVFDEWILGKYYINLRTPEVSEDAIFDLGKFNDGISVVSGQSVNVPAVSHFRLSEGTMEVWVRPSWKGLANDATLTFDDLIIDGYADISRIFIGFGSNNPTEIPFNLNTTDTSVFGEPTEIDSETGFFIWFDEFESVWNIRWRENRDEVHSFSGAIITSGEFINIIKPLGNDGYSINEISDSITSTITRIDFQAYIDGYDAAVNTDTYALDGISFLSGDLHYIFDMAAQNKSNRVSLFKDGTGYLNFEVFDNAGKLGRVGRFNLSSDVSDWQANESHQVAIAWKFNSQEEQDEMHLFIDGSEMPNLFKYGGNPKATNSYDFGNVGEETVISSASRPIVGGFDGSTESGSDIFRSQNLDFEALGIQAGDLLLILEDTPDGTGDPNFGAPYTVTGVGGNTISLSSSFTITLGNIHFAINQVVATVDTQVNFQDFIVVLRDADGNDTELSGVDSDTPDYSIRRGSDNSHVIEINNGVPLGETILIQTLGLIFRRFRERLFVYDDTDEIRTNSAAPVTLGDVMITKIIVPRTLITADGYGFEIASDTIDAQLVTLILTSFGDPCQPSNMSAGRKLAVTLSGSNIDFDLSSGNEVIIYGDAFSGATQETLIFTESGTKVSSEYWKDIEDIFVSVVPIDFSLNAGIIEVQEYKPLTESENNGDFAEVVQYSNGLLKLEIYGTGGNPFILEGDCYYNIDYPTFLRIKINELPDTFVIGNNFNSDGEFDGVIDEIRILDNMITDTRVGEPLASGETSITTDFNNNDEFVNDHNTLFLTHFNNEIDDVSVYRDRFDLGFEVAESVNSSFGYAIKISENKPYIIDNANVVFNNDEGSIEFWVNPLDDSRNDPNFHYYIDMSSVIVEEITSSTSVTVIGTQRIRSIESVRLATDLFNIGTDYFAGGSLSVSDRKVITLGTALPDQNTLVKVTYVPLNAQGDRVSVYRDPEGFINFFVSASGVEHLLSTPISWDRHTWHRIMIMWTINSADNTDRLRLFVDGSERGTIKYGTGLIYGTGVVYGQEEVRPGVNRFIVDNIDLIDTFARIFIGTDTLSVRGARALIDNIRFSNKERLELIKITSNDTMDVIFTANTELVSPVLEDSDTTKILDFNKDEGDIDKLATLINPESGIFKFNVDVIDSFNKVIGNNQLEQLLKDLINTIKPAHSSAIIKFTK